MDGDSLPPVLTLDQAADYLQLDPDELRAELEKGCIPGWKASGEKWRIKRDVLERLLESHPGVSEPAMPGTVELGAGLEKTGVEPSSTATLPVATESKDKLAAVQEPRTAQLYRAGLPPFEPLEETAAPAPPSGRVRGRVFSFNSKEGWGYARLPDNRIAWLDSRRLTRQTATPFPGDIVEFELRQSRKGLEAHAIQIVLGDKPIPAPEPASSGTAELDTKQLPARHVALPTPFQPAPKALKSSARPGGTPAAQKLYQKAALARIEGRYEDARRLFRQAIDAGAGVNVYSAFFQLEKEISRTEARRIIQQAIARFPNHAPFYEMYGQMERRARNYRRAEEIFREGLARFPSDVQLKRGLAQTLVQIGTSDSLREAGQVFEWLKRKHKLNTDDRLYQRFEALQRNPYANKAYDFFQAAGMRVGIAGRRDLPKHVTDIVVETRNQELFESFGLSGSVLVRCFERRPYQIEIVDLHRYIQGLSVQGALGLQDGREVVLNSSLAFIAVPESQAVRDQVMSILSESNEALIPLDDAIFGEARNPLNVLRELLGQYLGQRDLYSSTLPVSGRRFFGRERLLLQLTDEVHHGQFLGIYGLRKMGKTSLIYQLRDEKLSGEAVAYADLQASLALAVRDCAPLYWELERDLYVRLRERNPGAAELLRLGKVERFSDLPERGAQAGLLFAEDLRTFLDGLSAGRFSGIKRLVIVLDELERILPVAGQPGINGYIEFFGLLRGLAQIERYRGLLSSVVVAANAAVSERGYWEGRENPVFALYKPIFLPPLSQTECIEMIRTLGKGMSVYWEDEALAAVPAETGGHPFLTRSFCSRVIKQYPARPLNVTAGMVQEQISHFIRDESDKLEQIVELLRTNFPEEEAWLERIALDEAPAELPDESLRHLLGYCLIATDSMGYRMTLNLLRRWLRRRAGIKE